MKIRLKDLSVVLCVFFTGICFIHAQTITGSIKEESGKPIPKANILVKTDKIAPTISEFAIADNQGNIQYKLKKNYTNTVYLEINALNYEKAIDSIVNPLPNKQYNFDFILVPKTTQLEEVIISERRKFTIKKDTVVFNVEKYKDGTERKVEDVLRKLPGVEVAANGKVSYKGKEVAAVQLDGDDLFGSKYTIGTKNISIDMVDQIEAIENFSKNPLLKGIENSKAVALNLKLKKNRTDYSGTADVGYGYGDKSYTDVSTTLLGVSAKVKSFLVGSFSNTGSYPITGHNDGALLANSVDNQSNIYSKQIINPNTISNILGFNRSRVDDQWYGSYNILYKFSSNAKVKANIIYLKDTAFQEERFQNNFFTGEEDFGYTDILNSTQRDQARGLDLNFTLNTSKSSLLEIETVISKNDQGADTDFTRNLENSFMTGLSTDDFLLKNKLQFTYKLHKQVALQYISLYSNNEIPQTFNTTGNFFSQDDVNNSYRQQSEFHKETFQNRFIVLGRKKDIKYSFITGVDHQHNPFRSVLEENEDIVSDFQNNFIYQKTDYFSIVSGIYDKNSWKIEPAIALRYLDQNLRSNLNFSENSSRSVLVAEPSIAVTYKITPGSRLFFKGNYEQNTLDESYLFSNGVITSNRILKSNIPSFDLLKRQDYSIGYGLGSLAKNIDITAVVSYSQNDNTYVADVEVNPNFTGITYFQLPVTLDNWFFKASAERYLGFIQTTLKLTSSYGISEFKNVVNQSNIRDGEFKSYTGEIFAKTAFRIPVNFENFFTYSATDFLIDNESSNTNNVIKNSFKTIFKLARGWLFTFSYDYFRPNTKSNEDFSFLDFELKFKPEKIKWVSGRLIGKNLLDNRFFRQVENSDFSSTIYQSNLIPKYFMLSLDLSF